MYEYVDNGNLEQWLHGDVGAVSPLTWDIRMNIVLGMAKGCLNFFHCFITSEPVVYVWVSDERLIWHWG